MKRTYPSAGQPPIVDVDRRTFIGTMALAGAGISVGVAAEQSSSTPDQLSKVRPVTFSLDVNGVAHEIEADSRATLLDLLRENLKLTGTKKGCDRGQCGACTVLIEGHRVNSCLTFAVMHNGATITTVEGLAASGEPSALQSAFVEFDALQCGYCTPGQVCSATALLTEARAGTVSAATANVRDLQTPALTDAEIRERMSGNICRCGAYPNIVAAIRDVALKQGGLS